MLVGLITSSRHDYCQEACLYCVRKLSYPNYDYVVIDLDEDVDNFLNLEGKGYNVQKLEYVEPANKRTAMGRETIRQIAIKGNYDYILYLDADWLIPSDTIERLMAHGKDCVGFLYNYGFGRYSAPSIAKSGHIKMDDEIARSTLDRLDLYTWEEVFENLVPRGLVKCYGCGIGLITRKVFLVVPWRHCDEYPLGDDIQFWHETNAKGFEWWCDTTFKLTHLNTTWKGLRVMN